jgi:hypothetical protein
MTHLEQRDTLCLQISLELVAAKVLILPFAQRREWIEPLELIIDEAGMAHHNTSLHHTVKETWEKMPIFGVDAKGIYSRKGWIGLDVVTWRERSDFTAEPINHHTLGIANTPCEPLTAPALSHPSLRRKPLHRPEDALADLWKQMYVAMPVDKIWGAAKCFRKCSKLRGDFLRKCWDCKATLHRKSDIRTKRKKSSIRNGSISSGKRHEWTSKRDMQPDREAR